ncbi:uncharacterized protein LOC143021149 [Oratosquilla oratoria]|uniref:uncharacterized protein LOC143021149 n=1 Tax=Oratosquilla oratoria TaxID=337810 RepID=UPI003F770FEA
MNNRLKPLAEKILPENQTGFRPTRGTTDMIFTLRQLQEKCREQYQPLYMAFIDLTKAFDSVSRELLWNTLSTYGCPPKYIRILRLLHDGMFATALVNNGTTDPFQKRKLQRILNAFNKAYISLGLIINSKKTQILYQPSPNDPTRRELSIKLGGTTLENVDHFPYLGSHLSSNLDLSAESQHRLKCAGTAFGRLRNRIFQDHDIRTDTKMAVYNAVVIPTLLYASETWTTYRRHLDTLEKFHQRCLRSILNISWEDRRTNVSVLKAAKATSIEAHIIKSQLRWSGLHSHPQPFQYAGYSASPSHYSKPSRAIVERYRGHHSPGKDDFAIQHVVLNLEVVLEVVLNLEAMLAPEGVLTRI